MLSVPTKYAIRSLRFLADVKRNEFLPVTVLASRTDVPAPYLSKIVKKLANHKLIFVKKGPGGGVSFPMKSITFYQVCEALDDPIVRDTCMLSKGLCSTVCPCPYHHTWTRERKRILRLLRKLKISRG